jgi:hypothetical protein
MGNAVAPPMAAALGRCLLLAAAGAAPVGRAVIAAPDPEYESLSAACRAKGVAPYAEQRAVPSVSRAWSGSGLRRRPLPGLGAGCPVYDQTGQACAAKGAGPGTGLPPPSLPRPRHGASSLWA